MEPSRGSSPGRTTHDSRVAPPSCVLATRKPAFFAPALLTAHSLIEDVDVRLTTTMDSTITGWIGKRWATTSRHCSRQTRDLQPENDAYVSQRHFAGEAS